MRPDQQLLDDLAKTLVESVDDVLIPDLSMPLPDLDWIWLRWLRRRDRSEVLGHSTLVWSEDTLHWPGLWAPRSGTLTMLVGRMPEFWRQRGVVRFTAVGIGAWVWKYLEAVGFQPVTGDEPWLTDQWYEDHAVDPQWKQDPESPLYVAELGPPCRLEEYAAWKAGEIGEPGWHKSHNFRRSRGA